MVEQNHWISSLVMLKSVFSILIFITHLLLYDTNFSWNVFHFVTNIILYGRLMYFLLETKTLILEQFKARGKIEGKVQSYAVYFPFLKGISSPTVIIPLRVVHLLQLMSLLLPHNHPKFTVPIWVTPGIPSMALKKCIMTCSHHHYIT